MINSQKIEATIENFSCSLNVHTEIFSDWLENNVNLPEDDLDDLVEEAWNIGEEECLKIHELLSNYLEQSVILEKKVCDVFPFIGYSFKNNIWMDYEISNHKVIDINFKLVLTQKALLNEVSEMNMRMFKRSDQKLETGDFLKFLSWN